MGCCMSRPQVAGDDGRPVAASGTAAQPGGVSQNSKTSLVLVMPPSADKISPPTCAGKAHRQGVSRTLLERERSAFFDTRIQGDRDVWKLLEQVCQFIRMSDRTAETIEAASKMLIDASLMCPSGQIWDENRDIGDRARNREALRERRRQREAGQPSTSTAPTPSTGTTPGPASAAAETTTPTTSQAQEAAAEASDGAPARRTDTASAPAASSSAEAARTGRSRQMAGLWDRTGNHYFVPLWCLADPAGVVEDDAESEVDTVDRDMSEKSDGRDGDRSRVRYSYETETVSEKKSPTDEIASPDEEEDGAERVEVTVRLSDPVQDLRVVVQPSRSVAKAIQRIRRDANIPDGHSIRLIHAGKILDRSGTLSGQGWVTGSLLQVFVTKDVD